MGFKLPKSNAPRAIKPFYEDESLPVWQRGRCLSATERNRCAAAGTPLYRAGLHGIEPFCIGAATCALDPSCRVVLEGLCKRPVRPADKVPAGAVFLGYLKDDVGNLREVHQTKTSAVLILVAVARETYGQT